MSKSVKQIAAVISHKYHVMTAAFTCFFGIALFFIFSSTMTSFVGSFLHVHPSYTGGEIAGDFIAPVEDFNLVRYTVYQPVTNAKWQQNAEYWQLMLEFKDCDAVNQNLTIYIKLTQPESASDKDYDIALQLTEGEGKIYDNKGTYLCSTEYYELNKGSVIKLRIPLQNKKIQKVLGAKKTYHYIVPATRTAATPLEVNMEVRKNTRKEKAENAAYVKHIKELYAESRASAPAATTNPDAPSSNDVDACLTYYSHKLEEDQNDYISLVNYGMYFAIKGGQSNIMSALPLVNKGFEYMDKAEALAYNQPDEIEVLLTRASVCASVPEQVFTKSESGAENFIRIVSLTDDTTLKAYCYVMAYECYQKCGKDSNAFLSLQEAKKVLQ